MQLKYKRTHVPTGQTWIVDFPQSFKSLGGWVSDCEEKIAQWNLQGKTNGQQLWKYELVVEV